MAVDEERRRWNREALEAAGLDGLLSSQTSEVMLITGYRPVMNASIALLARGGDVVVLVPEDEADLAAAATDARIITYKGTTLSTFRSPIEGVAAPLSQTLKELGLDRGQLGLDERPTLEPAGYLATTQFGPSLRHFLSENFPQLSKVASDDLFAELKSRKTPQELARLRLACRVAVGVFSHVPELLRPGIREDEIAAELTRLFAVAPETQSSARSGGSFFCMSGPHAALAAASFATTRKRALARGDLVMIHANTSTDGFWTDITRTYTVGEESPEIVAMRLAIEQASKAALAAIRPGVRAAEVDAEVRAVLTRAGFGGDCFPHGTGHGVGFDPTDANARPRLHPASPDILSEGMTFNVEPAIYRKGFGGMRHCDMVAVTSSGAELLTRDSATASR